MHVEHLLERRPKQARTERGKSRHVDLAIRARVRVRCLSERRSGHDGGNGARGPARL